LTCALEEVKISHKVDKGATMGHSIGKILLSMLLAGGLTFGSVAYTRTLQQDDQTKQQEQKTSAKKAAKQEQKKRQGPFSTSSIRNIRSG